MFIFIFLLSNKPNNMKKIIAILLIFPLLSYSNNSILIFSKSKYSLLDQTAFIGNKNYAPKKSNSGGGKFDIPWGVSAAMILVGGGMAYYYGANIKNNTGLAITGGLIALTGGVFASISVARHIKGGRLFGMIDNNSNTAVALGPGTIKISHRF